MPKASENEIISKSYNKHHEWPNVQTKQKGHVFWIWQWNEKWIEVGAVDGALITVTYGVASHANTAYQCGGGVSDCWW